MAALGLNSNSQGWRGKNELLWPRELQLSAPLGSSSERQGRQSVCRPHSPSLHMWIK